MTPILSILLLVQEDLRPALLQYFAQIPDVFVTAATDNIRTALSTASQYDALILDDHLLVSQPGWVTTLTTIHPRPILLADPTIAAAQRALTLSAQSVMDRAQWAPALTQWLTLERHARPQRQPQRWVVFSSKGGVGKSTLALALACASQTPTLLLDYDLLFGDLDALAGLTAAATVADAIQAPVLTAETIQRTSTPIARTQAVFLGAPINPLQAERVSSQETLTLLTQAQALYPTVIIDTSTGYSDITVTLLDQATQIFLVLTPDTVTLRSGFRTLSLLREGLQIPDASIRIVLNRAGSGLSLPEITAALAHPVDFLLPSDGSLPTDAANAGLPLWHYAPHSRYRAQVEAMIHTLQATQEGPRASRTVSFPWPFFHRHRRSAH